MRTNAGRLEGYDYSDAPYRENWEPLQDRQWALRYIGTGPGGGDDQQGFLKGFRETFPHMYFATFPGFEPLVDYYVRNDSKGVRRDIDWELAMTTKPVSVIAEQAQKKDAEVERRWKEAQEAREPRQASPLGLPTPSIELED